MKQDLKDIFQNVNEWLKFAEAKHAGLIVLNSGLVFGILTVYSSFMQYLHWSFIILSLIFLGGSILFTLISLYPRTYKKILVRKKIKDPNLFFNGSIAHLTSEDFKTEICKSHPDYVFSPLEENLINQIINNSKIASGKYFLFKYAIICTTIGVSLPLLRIIFKVCFNC
ncbi:MAG: Pycsar system effector family protein [Bacteroidia bacterium]